MNNSLYFFRFFMRAKRTEILQKPATVATYLLDTLSLRPVSFAVKLNSVGQHRVVETMKFSKGVFV